MSRTHNPEIPQKLIDALIRTVIEQGFGPGIDAITERAGVSKMSAYAHFTTRPDMTVAALQRVGTRARKALDAAANKPGFEASCDLGAVTESLIEQLTDHDNPLAFITSCLLGHPDPRSKIHAAAMNEGARGHRRLAGELFQHQGRPAPAAEGGRRADGAGPRDIRQRARQRARRLEVGRRGQHADALHPDRMLAGEDRCPPHPGTERGTSAEEPQAGPGSRGCPAARRSLRARF